VSTKMAVFWDYTALHPRKQQFLKSYWLLKQMVHIVTIGLYKVN
jgi:hypothetical protein